ncbi:hypothetical protein BDC45DRAFT_433388, partial [Circinella umbellata]
AFGEAKSETADFKHTAIDFTRLAVFGKDCIDVNKMNKVLLFQIIGSKLSFYIEFLEDDGLYVIMELFHVDLPTSIEQLPSIIPKLDDFLDFYNTFATVSRDLENHEVSRNINTSQPEVPTNEVPRPDPEELYLEAVERYAMEINGNASS